MFNKYFKNNQKIHLSCTTKFLKPNIKNLTYYKILRTLLLKLKENKFLEKVELEGNWLGPNTAFEIGELLKINKTIR